jgi:uncharacterized protein involved in response to NO
MRRKLGAADDVARVRIALADRVRAAGFAFALAAEAWCVGFGVFLVRYAPLLWRPRADGRLG